MASTVGSAIVLTGTLVALAAPAATARGPWTVHPDLGVACRTANSIACDRVGVAVLLHRPALRVDARVNGRRLRLRPPSQPGTPWIGYLHHAGLLHGSLRVTPDRRPYFWAGGHPRTARVRLTIVRPSGHVDRASQRVPLRAGWG